MTITQPLTSSSSSTTSSSYNSSSSFDSNSLFQTSSSGFDSLSSYQNRNQNALQRRAQQLRRWREIEELEQKENTGQAQKPKTQTKVCFSATTLFLSACAQNDIDECERLLCQKELQDSGGVNVSNCDGLTALHQACIDDNEPQVKWLLSKNANINCKDNEGWTPLHASASCGNSNIVSILILHPECDIFALNCDNELACDVCESKECEMLIRHRMNELMGCESSYEVNISGDDQDDNERQVFKDMRQQELKTIDRDINEWIRNIGNIDIKSEFERTRDALSGATILHVCAAKGYNEILIKLLTSFENKIDLDSFRDCDGYTALHAAAFWKQPETFETLLKYGANPELPTEKTSENIISSSVLELCKNDPKFVQLIEINKEKEKIAKESETQRKIFAKRQREIRRSTQGVKKEDLEKALKIMEISQNSSNSSEKDFNSIMMKVNNIETSIDSTETQSDTLLTSTPKSETDTTCWTIKLPPKLSLNVSSDNVVTSNEVNHDEDAKKIVEPSTPDTPPTVTMTISSTTPAEFARRRRIKRRSTGIEDDRGLIVSPESLPDATNPFASNETVDAAFDVILSSPSLQSRSRTTTTNRPISNASSTTSLNSVRSVCDSEANRSKASSIQSLDCIDSDANSHSKLKNSVPSEANDLRSSTVSLVSESDLKAIQSGTSVSDEIDYKKLCKQLIRENETLRRRIKELEEGDKKREQEFNREKRSLQRTISEQEEEMKAMNDIKADNVRLKDENAALIRVISKLSK